MQTKHLCVLIHIWTKGEVGAPLNWFKPSSKIFFTDPSKAELLLWIIYVISVLFYYAFIHVCLLIPCGHLLGMGWPLGSRLWCLIVTLSLSHWYPVSGVVLDCIDSWSLPTFLLMIFIVLVKFQFWGPVTLHTVGPDRQFFQRRTVNICLSISQNICFGAQMNRFSRQLFWEATANVFFRNKKK